MYIGWDSGAEAPFGTVSRDCFELLDNAEILRIRRDPGYRLANLVHGLIGPEVLRRYAENDSNSLRQLYALRTAALSRPLENQLLHRCYAHTVCSEREREREILFQ